MGEKAYGNGTSALRCPRRLEVMLGDVGVFGCFLGHFFVGLHFSD